MISFFKKYIHFGIILVVFLSCLTLSSCKPSQRKIYQGYMDFFEQVYTTMNANYYQPVSRETYEAFIKKFHEKIYTQLKQEGKSIDYVRWRTAAFLIDELKSEEDIFSAFFPPKPAQKYEAKALGKVVGPRRHLGFKGELLTQGYKVSEIEPRCDAYVQGLRVGDIILKIGEQDTRILDKEEVEDLLNPDADSITVFVYLDARQQEREIDVMAKEYFKKQISITPVKVPGIYCLKLSHFNRKTFDDMLMYLKYFREKGDIRGLILDLRDNPGGPPLAAREISGFFLKGGEEFTYFQRKGDVKSSLDVPEIPEEYRYNGPMVILINQKTGSASELFSGVLQRRGRTILMGVNSAGQVMLKSMFHFDDGSMALFVTARGHHADGAVFSFEGLTPDKVVSEDDSVDVLTYAMKYLVYINRLIGRTQGSPLQ